MSRRPDRSFGVMGVAALAVAAALVALSLHMAARLQEEARSADRTPDLHAGMEVIRTTLLELETRQRDQLLTPDPRDLQAQRERLAQLARQEDALQAQLQAARMAGIVRDEQLLRLLALGFAVLLVALLLRVRSDRALQARTLRDETAAREELAQRVTEHTASLEAATQRLLLSEERLRRIFADAGEGILTTNADQVILEANEASARMFGCEVADLIGTRLDRLIPERYRQAHSHSVEAFGTGATTSRPMLSANGRRDVMALRLDGQEIPIVASISRTEVNGQRLYTVIHSDLSAQRRAERALRLSQQLIAATFEATNVAMAQIDPATRRFVAVNAALCALSGYTESTLLTMSPDDLNHPQDAIDTARFTSMLKGDAPYRQDKRIVRSDGQVVWVDVAASVVRDADGHPVRVVGVLLDITARRDAEQALRQREERLSFIVRLNDRLRELGDPQAIAYEAACLLGEFAQVDRVGYARDDGNGDTITVARNFTRGVPDIEGCHRYLDYGPQLVAELRAGRTVVRPDIAHDPSLSESEKAAHAVRQLGATVNVPMLEHGQLQSVFFVHATTAHAWSEDEVRLFEDVAHRIRADIHRAVAQVAERAASAKLAAAIQSMTDAVFIADAEGRFVDFNLACLSFHRFRNSGECCRTMAQYTEILDVVLPDGTLAAPDLWAVPRALRGETASNVEYRLRRKDTGEAWVGSYSYGPIRADDGQIVGAVVSARDVTQLKRTQEDLASSHVALQQLIDNQQRVQEDERKRIARELHDDLQQSLAAISMEAVAIGQRAAKGRRDIQSMLARIERLAGAAITSTRRIVSDLRPEMLEELGLRPALEALCGEQARRWGVECRFESFGADDAAHLDGVALSVGLFRIAQEALNNVAKHAKASVVRISLDATQPEHVTLRIADNGIGMRSRQSRDAESFGLLGMAERVRAMGGTLRIDSPAGQGTVIEAVVPLLRPEAMGHPTGDPAPHARQAEPALPRRTQVWDVWRRPLQAVIDAMDGQVAVLDQQGTIQLVNRPWRDFAASHGDTTLAGCGPGVDYLEVCRRSAADDPSAAIALAGLNTVLAGRNDAFTTEYPCETPAGRCWYRIHAASITGGLAIVSHVKVHGPGEPAAPAEVPAADLAA